MHSKFAINKKVPTMNYNRGDWATPVVEFSEGIRPNGQFMPHPSLPLVRGKGDDIFTQVVVSTGKIVALSSDGFLVPAGLLLNATLAYSQFDVDEGVLDPSGDPVAVGDLVKDAFEAANITVSAPVGVASYDYLRHPGGDGTNPLNYNYSNLNYQHKVAFTTDYVVQLPLVEDAATYAKAPMKGIAAFISAKGTAGAFTVAKPGDLVTFDEDSNFVVAGAGVTGIDKVIGQVLQVVEPDTFGLLNLVNSPSNGGGVLNQMPGTANGGVPEAISYSGGYGLIRVNLINR